MNILCAKNRCYYVTISEYDASKLVVSNTHKYIHFIIRPVVYVTNLIYTHYILLIYSHVYFLFGHRTRPPELNKKHICVAFCGLPLVVMAIFFLFCTRHTVLPPTNVYVNAPTRLVHRAREISHDDRAIHPATTLVFRPTVATGLGNEKCDRIDFVFGPCRIIEAEEMKYMHKKSILLWRCVKQ